VSAVTEKYFANLCKFLEIGLSGFVTWFPYIRLFSPGRPKSQQAEKSSKVQPPRNAGKSPDSGKKMEARKSGLAQNRYKIGMVRSRLRNLPSFGDAALTGLGDYSGLELAS
jgi:hypothetical protein